MNEEYSIPQFMLDIEGIVDKPRQMETVNFDCFHLDNFYHTINNLDVISERDRFTFVKSNIDFISDQVLNNTCRYMKKLVEPIFLAAYKEVLQSMPITYARQLAANRLCYSYPHSKNPDQSITAKLVEICSIVNRPYVQALKSVGLSEHSAVNLAIARFSSIDENVNVNRLNYAIYLIGQPIMSEQQIIYIYETLFDQVRYLFIASMFETKDNMTPPAGTNVDSFYETFSTASLALLTIVNNLTLGDIGTLLRLYIDKWNSVGHCNVRFPLRALSADHGRIRDMVEAMELNGTIVP